MAAYSLEALAPTLTTPEAAFAFVRDQIAYEPYVGVMKGATGALLTRGGNSWDRALLLHKLLAAQGVEAQLAVATLSEQEGLRRQAVFTAGPDAITMVAKATVGTAPDTAELRQQRALWRKRAAQRGAQLQELEAAPPAWTVPATAGLVPTALAAPSELVWVRAVIGERMVDLDPSLPINAIGTAPTVVGEVTELAEAPEEVQQRLTLRFVVEELGGDGALARRDLLERGFSAASLQESGLRLALMPVVDDKGLGDFRWTLFAAGEEASSESFRLTGAPKASATANTPSLGLGDMWGGATEETPEASGQPTAETRLGRLFVEFKFSSPGMPDETFRRTVIDRVEPDGERWRLVPALTEERTVRPLLAQVWDAALDCGATHPLYVRNCGAGALKSLQPILLAAHTRTKIDPADISTPSVSPQLLAFSLASGARRHVLCAGAGGKARSFAVRPRLLLLRHGAEIVDWTKLAAVAPRYREGADIVNTPFRFLAQGTQAIELARLAGVADTALEVHVLAKPAALNTLRVFAAAAKQGVKLRQVRTPADLQQGALPPPVRAALLDELAAGHRLTLPEAPVAYAGGHVYAWWSVDPASGYALGRMDLGGGQGMAEYEEFDRKLAEWTKLVAKFYGSIMKCYMTEFAKALGSVEFDPKAMKVDVTLNQGAPGESPLPDTEQLVNCVIDAACSTLLDLIDSRYNVTGLDKDIEALQDMIADFEELSGKKVEGADKIKTVDAAFNDACKSALGGGGGE